MRPRYHVTVVGAGLVGASTALALAKAGMQVALIEPRAPDTPGDTWDSRIYAISPGSEAFLTRLGAWQRLDPARIQPVYRMAVAGDAGGKLRMDAYQAGVPRLATIIESGRLQDALWRTLSEHTGVTRHCPAAVDAIEWGEPVSRLTLADGRVIETELVVGAEGRASPVRALAGIEANISPYGQTAVVANFACEQPHRGTAFQWFARGDIVAYLPLPGNRMSLVWSTSADEAERLVALPAPEFCEQVAEAGHRQLGTLELLTPAAAFPLSLMQIASPARPGCTLVGDAAHGVHPLAGQGVNLGFGDAEALVEVLAARGAVACGDLRLLERHVRRRAGPVARMQAVTDGLLRLFRARQAVPALARNTGMNLLDGIGPLKSALVHEAFFN